MPWVKKVRRKHGVKHKCCQAKRGRSPASTAIARRKNEGPGEPKVESQQAGTDATREPPRRRVESTRQSTQNRKHPSGGPWVCQPASWETKETDGLCKGAAAIALTVSRGLTGECKRGRRPLKPSRSGPARCRGERQTHQPSRL